MKSSRQDGKVLILVSAYSCHEGGGKTLLIDLLDALNIHGNGICYIDTRLELNKSYPNIKFRKFRPKLISRLQAEYLIYKEKKPQDILLCFGNLPPLIKSNSNTYIFLQNRFLIDKTISIKSNLKTFIRLFMERIWFKYRKSDEYTYIVQTPSMSSALKKIYNSSYKIRLMPFTNSLRCPSVLQHSKKYGKNNSILDRDFSDIIFAYIASGDPHKNHTNLIKSWCLLAKEGIYPELNLTVSESFSPGICGFINKLKVEHDLNIINHGNLSRNHVNELYKNSNALIYPSKLESFGLPLFEAVEHQLPILASELDYVRDAIDPIQSFDPNSPISISRAVKRFLEIKKEPSKIYTSEKFLAKLVSLSASME